jgi:hypothetical protein
MTAAWSPRAEWAREDMAAEADVEKVVDAALLDALDRMLDAVSALTKVDATGMAQELRAPIHVVTGLIDWNRAHPGWSQRPAGHYV